MPLPAAFEAIRDVVFPRSPAPAVTVPEIHNQWNNPNDVLSVIMIIGGSIVQKALAQLSGGSFFVPVCFSFGWISLGFMNIVALAGDGRLMPTPDYSCKVVNVDTGYVRDNRSWMLGRILRDSEGSLKDESLCVTIWDAVGGDGEPEAGKPVLCKLWIWSIFIIIVQLVIAAIPLILDGDWGVLLISSAGALIALATGALPQWKTEKYACRTTKSKKRIILTGGNGTRHAMLINGNGHCLDLEDLAGGEGPRVLRPWNKYGIFRRTVRAPPSTDQNDKQGTTTAQKPGATSVATTISPPLAATSKQPLEKEAIASGPWLGNLPLDLWFTRFVSAVFAVLWILLLITVTGLKRNAWFVLLVGAIGMIQNAFVASVPRDPSARGVHLDGPPETGESEKRIHKGKVMDVLMDLEYAHPNAGWCLLKEFFPGRLRPEEDAWWDAALMRRNIDEYNEKRRKGKAATPPDWDALYKRYGGEKEWKEMATSYDKTRREDGWRGEPRGLFVTKEQYASTP